MELSPHIDITRRVRIQKGRNESNEGKHDGEMDTITIHSTSKSTLAIEDYVRFNVIHNTYVD